MIKIENEEIVGFEHAIRGMRNSMNSYGKSDSVFDVIYMEDVFRSRYDISKPFKIGQNDLSLMKKLAKAGTDNRKFMKMLVCYVDLTCPLYFWKEFDTTLCTVANGCSTLNKIQEKEFTLDDFSLEHLNGDFTTYIPEGIVRVLNSEKESFLETNDKQFWWDMIQLLLSCYNQRRTVMLDYEVLANIYKSRKNHKLDEWQTLCDWIQLLPCSEIITDCCKENENVNNVS